MENIETGAGDDYPVIPHPHTTAPTVGTLVSDREYRLLKDTYNALDKAHTKQSEQVQTLLAKLKAAEDVIETMKTYIGSISGRDITVDAKAFENSEQAIVNYKSL